MECPPIGSGPSFAATSRGRGWGFCQQTEKIEYNWKSGHFTNSVSSVKSILHVAHRTRYVFTTSRRPRTQDYDVLPHLVKASPPSITSLAETIARLCFGSLPTGLVQLDGRAAQWRSAIAPSPFASGGLSAVTPAALLQPEESRNSGFCSSIGYDTEAPPTHPWAFPNNKASSAIVDPLRGTVGGPVKTPSERENLGQGPWLGTFGREARSPPLLPPLPPLLQLPAPASCALRNRWPPATKSEHLDANSRVPRQLTAQEDPSSLR